MDDLIKELRKIANSIFTDSDMKLGQTPEVSPLQTGSLDNRDSSQRKEREKYEEVNSSKYLNKKKPISKHESKDES